MNQMTAGMDGGYQGQQGMMQQMGMDMGGGMGMHAMQGNMGHQGMGHQGMMPQQAMGMDMGGGGMGMMGGGAGMMGGMMGNAGMGMGTAPSFPAMPEIDKMAEMLARMNQESMGGNQDVSGNQRGTSAAPSTMVPGGQASGKRTFTGNPLGNGMPDTMSGVTGMGEQAMPGPGSAMDFADMSRLFQMIQQQHGAGGGMGMQIPDHSVHEGNNQNQDPNAPSTHTFKASDQSDMLTGGLMSPGVQLWRDPRNKEMTVISVPNKSCPIKEGDIIKCIDGRKVKEWSVEKCYHRLQGAPGSKVEIITKKGNKVMLSRSIPAAGEMTKTGFGATQSRAQQQQDYYSAV